MNHYKKLISDIQCQYVVLSGSVPKGVPDNIYYDMVSMAKHENKTVIVDGRPPYLNHSLLAKPDIVKPNRNEFMELTGMSTWCETSAIELGCYLVKRFETIILLSLGDDGALYFTEDQCYRVTITDIDVVNTIGSGDAMVAGMIVGLLDRLPVIEMLKKATGFSMSNALIEGIGCINELDVCRLEKEIKISVL